MFLYFYLLTAKQADTEDMEIPLWGSPDLRIRIRIRIVQVADRSLLCRLPTLATHSPDDARR